MRDRGSRNAFRMRIFQGSQLHGEAIETWRPGDTAAALSGFSQISSNAAGNTLLSDALGQSDLDLGGPVGSSGTSSSRSCPTDWGGMGHGNPKSRFSRIRR